MDTGIGATLRKTRNRRKVGLSEVEAVTKIRLRYLRAMENEEWDVLPGGAYSRGFIRTYASFLGLDGERLADEYRREMEVGASGEPGPRAEATVASPRPPRRGPRLSTRAWTAIVTVCLVAVLVAVGISTWGGETVTTGTGPTHKKGAKRATAPPAQKPRSGVSVRLVANAEVWVCLLDASGKRLVDGQILEAGAREGPFHSGSFTVSFGNGEVSMNIDGQQASIPATSSPIGYSIDSGGRLEKLPESKRPTCA
ncbi:MAG TPA: helix-turn-helix domain-containing protein [Solirubrobacterales bacterium]|nr:helix-turn-helix domain-containing protein [Solirubrobacterales bacterium]